ncbi:hypothetical protein V866_005821 [Kwoniella sp. B9012]|uniref:Uncharacterized protein n=1 Tax=Kwoniella europaea PYCC6329 TaxID=1423913 RepID=A0AAX4KSY7_9TREE
MSEPASEQVRATVSASSSRCPDITVRMEASEWARRSEVEFIAEDGTFYFRPPSLIRLPQFLERIPTSASVGRFPPKTYTLSIGQEFPRPFSSMSDTASNGGLTFWLGRNENDPDTVRVRGIYDPQIPTWEDGYLTSDVRRVDVGCYTFSIVGDDQQEGGVGDHGQTEIFGRTDRSGGSIKDTMRNLLSPKHRESN